MKYPVNHDPIHDQVRANLQSKNDKYTNHVNYGTNGFVLNIGQRISTTNLSLIKLFETVQLLYDCSYISMQKLDSFYISLSG